MKNLFSLAATVALFPLVALVALPECTPGAAAPTNTTTASARAAVSLAADAWNLAATACQDAADLEGDAGVGVLGACAQPLIVAHDLIVDAAGAVDSGWNNGAACNLVQGVELIGQAAQDPNLKLGADVQAVLQDAATVAKGILGTSICKGDGGAADAPSGG